MYIHVSKGGNHIWFVECVILRVR